MKNKMLTSLYRVNQDFERKGIFLNLSGPLSQTLMVEMGGLMKTKMRLEGSDAATIRKAFSVLVELNQNIIHYSAEMAPENKSLSISCKNGCGIISVGRGKDCYFLLSGNLVRHDKVDKLRNRLEHLRKMTQEELKEEYHHKRKQAPDIDSKGAGLGLIDIARKASRPLEFEFRKIDKDYAFFTLKTVI